MSPVPSMTAEESAVFYAPKHTPGPWSYEDGVTGVRACGNRLKTAGRTKIAKANRALIAAAPGLLAALLFYGGHDPDNSDHGDWVQRMNEDGGDVARAAITKALGA